MSLKKDDDNTRTTDTNINNKDDKNEKAHAISSKKKSNDNIKNVNKKTKRHIYISYKTRLFFNIILFIVFLSLGTVLLIESFTFKSEKVVKYDENSNVDYKVYLLDNEFYDNDYLDKDMLYVASLIKNIGIDFKYNFNSQDVHDIDFTYDIIAKLTITNEAGTKSYFEKNYNLIEDKSVNMRNSNKQEINEHLVIDYPYYNSLASGFRSKYGIDAVSKLTIYMVVNKKNTTNSNFSLDNNSVMNLIIPLSEKAIDISLDYQEINNTSDIVEKQDVLLKSVLVLVISIFFIVFSLIMMVKLMRKISLLFNKKSKYDKYIKKILKEYDRLVAESNTMISLENKEIIKINNFNELLDIHDNLSLPIMYYQVTKHQKCYFYIYHDNTVYLNTVKACDLE